MDWLWIWGGTCFGYRDGDALWTHDGRHVGQFHGHEIYARDGTYLGELAGGHRLVTCLAKSSRLHRSFTPLRNRRPYPRHADLTGQALSAGWADFAAPETLR